MFDGVNFVSKLFLPAITATYRPFFAALLRGARNGCDDRGWLRVRAADKVSNCPHTGESRVGSTGRKCYNEQGLREFEFEIILMRSWSLDLVSAAQRRGNHE